MNFKVYIYCINLPEHKSRRLLFEKEYEKEKLLNENLPEIRWYDGYQHPKLRRGTKVQIAHLNLWKKILNETNPEDLILILEDDVLFQKGWFPFIKFIHNNLRNQYDLFFLGYQGRIFNSLFKGPFIKLGPHPFRGIKNVFHGLYAYMTHHAGLKKLINTHKLMLTNHPNLKNTHLDWILRITYGKLLNAYALKKELIKHR